MNYNVARWHWSERGLSPSEQRAWDESTGQLASAAGEVGTALSGLLKALERPPVTMFQTARTRLGHRQSRAYSEVNNAVHAYPCR